MLEFQTLGIVGLRSRDVGDSVGVPVQPKRLALLARSGDPAGALAAYEQLRRWLEAEFQTSPSPATEALVAGIRANGATAGKRA